MSIVKVNSLQKLSKKNSTTKSGFSLIEVLITLVILSVGITGVSTLMTGNIRNSVETKNQIIASELAQEGLELVKNLKDNNSLVFATEVADGSDYRIDGASSYSDFKSSPISFSGNINKKLNLDGSGFYSHAAGKESGFYRKIEITITPSRTVEATAYVAWNPTGSFSPCIATKKCVSVQAVFPDLN